MVASLMCTPGHEEDKQVMVTADLVLVVMMVVAKVNMF